MEEISINDLMHILQAVSTSENETDERREIATFLIMAIGNADRGIIEATDKAYVMRAQGLTIDADCTLSRASERSDTTRDLAMTISTIMFKDYMKGGNHE